MNIAKTLFLIISLGVFSCKSTNTTSAIDQKLADHLLAMRINDQKAAMPPEDRSTVAQWNVFKDSIYDAHCRELQVIFSEKGYLGYDKVGKDGEKAFWLMVQHCDHAVEFQEQVLGKMKIELANENANPRNFGLLTDRVRINRGLKQVYGTQLSFNPEKQAIPKPLEDSLNVDKRRAEVGLEPIIEYLNSATISHYEMNKEVYKKRGIEGPLLHKQ